MYTTISMQLSLSNHRYVYANVNSSQYTERRTQREIKTKLIKSLVCFVPQSTYTYALLGPLREVIPLLGSLKKYLPLLIFTKMLVYFLHRHFILQSIKIGRIKLHSIFSISMTMHFIQLQKRSLRKRVFLVLTHYKS